MPVVDGFFTAFACAPFLFRFAIISVVAGLPPIMILSMRMQRDFIYWDEIMLLYSVVAFDAVPTRTSNLRWQMRNFSRFSVSGSSMGAASWGKLL
jgi:hypothetical protein